MGLNLVESIQEIVTDFATKTVLVVGDVMLDEYQWCDVSRISPEAPVPVCHVTHKTHELGGAGNVANNIVALGGTVLLATAIGTDTAADKILDLMDEKSINTDFVCRTQGSPTSVKSRVIAKKQQVLRLDEESTDPLADDVADTLIKKIQSVSEKIDVIVLSDYAKGMLTHRVISEVISLAKRDQTPVLVDPKGREFEKYQSATYITPNFSEFCQVVGDVGDEAAIVKKASEMIGTLDLEALIITRSEKGITVVSKDESVCHCETKVQDVVDITGAGDTVIATVALALSIGVSLGVAIELANYAAGIVVGKVGAATATSTELVDVVKRRSKA